MSLLIRITPLVNPSARYFPSAGASLLIFSFISDYNQWAFDALVKVDETSRAELEDPEPPTTIFTTFVYCQLRAAVLTSKLGSMLWVELYRTSHCHTEGL